VAFEEAATAFADPDGLDWEDVEHSFQEQRHRRIGRSVAGRVLLVGYTIGSVSHGQEAIRLISARQASKKELTAYAG
jgi:uncharacterized DUF497 family protein